jgi:hypothetical protein
MWEEDSKYQQGNFRALVWAVVIGLIGSFLISLVSGDWQLFKLFLEVMGVVLAALCLYAAIVWIRNMKRQIIIGIIILAGGLLFSQTTQAQGTTYVSNLGMLSTSNTFIGSDSWLAMSFFTGTNAGGYNFNSAKLRMANATGNPSGFTFMLYSAIVSSEASPGGHLSTLNGSLSPVTGGIFTYDPTSSLILSPSTAYFIVLTSGTAIANGAYEWSIATTSASYNPSGGWEAPFGAATADNYQSSNGSSWGFAHIYPEFDINATPVPEPGVFLLLGLGGLLFLGLRINVIRDQSSEPPLAQFVPLSRFTSRVGGVSAR